MIFITIDLGTTNTKISLYDKNLKLLYTHTSKVEYSKSSIRYEIQPDAYYQKLLLLISNAIIKTRSISENEEYQIILTGQAESFILIDKDGREITPIISWLDQRSEQECREISQSFKPDEAYAITGQYVVSTTWTATKIRWIRNHSPELLKKCYKVLLLKDYIQYKLTGVIVGEASIRGFTYFFNYNTKEYWQEMLDFCGLKIEQLPDICEPCTLIGNVNNETACKLPKGQYTVNTGALDHIANIIGLGAYREKTICESTGTVLAVSTIVEQKPTLCNSGHCILVGPKNKYIIFNCCDSGGICITWFNNIINESNDYSLLDEKIKEINTLRAPYFLPYITGINPPDYYHNSSGIFYGLKIEHQKKDMLYSVYESLAFQLCDILKSLENDGFTISHIVSSGGGSSSQFLSELKADLINKTIVTPKNNDGTSLGAAIIGAVQAGYYKDYSDAYNDIESEPMIFKPATNLTIGQRYNEFLNIKKIMSKTFKPEVL